MVITYHNILIMMADMLHVKSCRFDSLRITPRSLDILSRGSPVCGDLAVSLSQAGPQFTQVRRGFCVMCIGLSMSRASSLASLAHLNWCWALAQLM